MHKFLSEKLLSPILKKRLRTLEILKSWSLLVVGSPFVNLLPVADHYPTAGSLWLGYLCLSAGVVPKVL